MIKEKIIEQRKVLKVSCYKYHKYIYSDTPELAECDFGFEDINHLCKNCIWFSVKKVPHEGKPLVSDREIDGAEIEKLIPLYDSMNRLMNSRKVPVSLDGKVPNEEDD